MSVIEGPENVWQSFTDPALTTRHWRHRASGGLTYLSDRQKGSTHDVAYEEAGLLVGDPEQPIFTPEWAVRHGFDDASVSAWGAEPRFKDFFDIEEVGEGVVKPAGRRRQPQDAARDRVRPSIGVAGGLPSVAVPVARPPAGPWGVPGVGPPCGTGLVRRRILSMLLQIEQS